MASSDDPQAEDAFAPGQMTIITRLEVDPPLLAQFNQLFAVYAADVRAYEPGCEFYEVVRAFDSPTHVVVIARYASLEAYRAHVNAPHTVSILSRLDKLLTAEPKLEIYVA
jgi:quinol monooxygenase YgiN